MEEPSEGSLVCLVGLSGSGAQYNYHHATVVRLLPDDRCEVKLCGGKRLACSKVKLRVLPKELRGVEGSLPTLRGSVSLRTGLRLLAEAPDNPAWGFDDGVARAIMAFLQVPWLRPEEVRVAGCSSTRGDFPLASVLESNDEWWISAQGSAPGGRGAEHLDFAFLGPDDTHRGDEPPPRSQLLSRQLSPPSSGHEEGASAGRPLMRRVTTIGIRIPPLPHGPLSVRDFRVLAKGHAEEDWRPASPPLRTMDSGKMQHFALVPPIDACALRIVFTSSAAACQADDDPSYAELRVESSLSCFGLFQIEIA